jgi:hypothetical protein
MPQFVTVSPASTNKQKAFDLCVSGKYIPFGWLKGIDLSGKTKEEISKIVNDFLDSDKTYLALMQSRHPEWSSEKLKKQFELEKKNVLRETLSFLSLRIGDIVIVPKVNYGLFGIGRIISEYKFQVGKHDSTGDGSDNYDHYYEVDWIETSYIKKSDILLPGEPIWQPYGACGKVWSELPKWLERYINKKLEQPEEVAILEVETSIDEDTLTEEVEPVGEYKGDPFTINTEGNYVGDDGFVVPKNFNEFYSRYPLYVRSWVQKHLYKRFIIDADVEDQEADLLMHLHYLPEKSKARLPGTNGKPEGCADVIEYFSPTKQYGASAKRFFNYLNLCLTNRFITMKTKRDKNPIQRTGNYALGAPVAPDSNEMIDDEFIHSHSSVLSQANNKENNLRDMRIYLGEFKAFVEKYDPELLHFMEVLGQSKTKVETREELGMDESSFNRAMGRVLKLKDSFINGTSVPKQRKKYKQRQMKELVNV